MLYSLEQIKLVNILDTDDVLKEKVRVWRNKERIRKGMLKQHIISPEEHKDWLGKLADGDDQKFWVVFLDDTPFGIISLNCINAVKRTSEWGFYIGEESFLGKGLGRQMMCKLLIFYFDSMGYEKLVTKALSDNDQAIYLYRQFKFQQTGTEKYSKDKDVIILSFSSQDWDKHKKELIDACN